MLLISIKMKSVNTFQLRHLAKISCPFVVCLNVIFQTTRAQTSYNDNDNCNKDNIINNDGNSNGRIVGVHNFKVISTY